MGKKVDSIALLACWLEWGPLVFCLDHPKEVPSGMAKLQEKEETLIQ